MPTQGQQRVVSSFVAAANELEAVFPNQLSLVVSLLKQGLDASQVADRIVGMNSPEAQSERIAQVVASALHQPIDAVRETMKRRYA